MKSKIKVDVDFYNDPVITIESFENNEDLRDKMLTRFLQTLLPNGRLAFIDQHGSKYGSRLNCCEASSETSKTFTIHTIDPNDYEVIIEEICTLIKERDKDISKASLQTKKDRLEKMTKQMKERILQY